MALILALLMATVLGTLPLVGLHRGVPAWVALARPAALVQGLLVAIAWGCLVASFVGNDFSVRNVAENANSNLPLPYRIAAAWGSHEGSMLLWLLMQAGWTAAVAVGSRTLPPALATRILAVMGWISAAFLLFVLFTSNPFLRVLPVPLQGRDLNPLLQDPGMVLHPPLLYMGYVGFSVAFAAALAALMGGERGGERGGPRGGERDAAWARWCRPWTLLAWCCLTAGVALGSWWAYTELGWGGWWFWDPVENAAFMPWLVGTALVHALAVAGQRARMLAWAALLAILCFSLSLLGTFLVRSGVLSSVHAFAIDPRRGVFILALLALVIGGSLALFALRAPRLASAAPLRLLSREGLLLLNNVLLLVAMGSVLLGTLYPLLMDVLGLGRISVGAPYFDAVFAPLMIPLLLLLGIGPFLRWQASAPPGLWRRLTPTAAASAALAMVLPWAWGAWQPMVALGLGLALWPALSVLTQVADRARGGLSALRRQPLAWWGMNLAHLGVAVFVAGVTLVRTQQVEIERRMAPGDAIEIGGRTLRFVGVAREPGPNYEAERGRFVILHGGRTEAELRPEKRRYASMPGTPMTEAAIASSLTGDLYVALGDPLADGAWTVRAYHKPFVTWIWGGCALMALGGLCAAVRYRRDRV